MLTLFLFIGLVISSLLTILNIFDESPLAGAIDIIMKGIVVFSVGMYLLEKLN